jgi:hypothetical protein
MKRLLGSVFALGFGLLLAGAVSAAPLTFRATLTGDQEVPPVDSNTRGSATFRVDPGLTQLRFDVRVTSGTAITQAHLHCAAAGVNGPVVVFLFGPEDPGVNVSGRLASGTLENADIIATDGDPCGATINNIASLYAAILDGRIYANVHSAANPGGEVRSQLFP